MELISERLRIRPLHPRDEEAYCKILSDPLVSGTLQGSVQHGEQKQFIRDLKRPQLSRMFKQRLRDRISGKPSKYAITRAGNSQFVGSIGSYPIDDRRIGLSYWLSSDQHGKGFGSEALRMYCYSALQLFRRQVILANIANDNPASVRAARKAGFRDSSSNDDPGFGTVRNRTLLEMGLRSAAQLALGFARP